MSEPTEHLVYRASRDLKRSSSLTHLEAQIENRRCTTRATLARGRCDREKRGSPRRARDIHTRNPAGITSSAQTRPAAEPSAPTLPTSTRPPKRQTIERAEARGRRERRRRGERRLLGERLVDRGLAPRGLEQEERLVERDAEQHREHERVVDVPAHAEQRATAAARSRSPRPARARASATALARRSDTPSTMTTMASAATSTRGRSRASVSFSDVSRSAKPVCIASGSAARSHARACAALRRILREPHERHGERAASSLPR